MFIRFNGLRHPETLGGPVVEAFLSWLANERNLSASRHKQALSALLFLYSKVHAPAVGADGTLTGRNERPTRAGLGCCRWPPYLLLVLLEAALYVFALFLFDFVLGTSMRALRLVAATGLLILQAALLALALTTFLLFALLARIATLLLLFAVLLVSHNHLHWCKRNGERRSNAF